jgi:hypothetical protein
MNSVLAVHLFLALLAAGMPAPEPNAGAAGLVSAAQAQVAERMAQVEQRLLELSAMLRDQQPDRAQQMSRALALSRERFIVANMDRARQLVAQGRYDEASRLQQRILDDVAGVALALSAEPAEGEVSRLRDALARLEALLAAQADALARTRALPEGDLSRLQAAVPAQTQVRTQTWQLYDESGGVPGADSLADAVAQMLAAEQALGGGLRAQALEAQLDALEKLGQARQELQQAAERLEAQLRAQQRASLRALVRSMLGEQQAIRAQTEALPAPVEPPVEVPRARQLQLTALAARERGLLAPLDEAGKLLEADGTTAVLPAVLGQVRADMTTCAGWLESGAASQEVIALEQDIEAALQGLLDALYVEPAEPSALPQQAGQKARQARPPAPRLVAPVAELKLTRAMQVRIRDEAARLDALRAGAPELPAALRERAFRLADSQAAMAEAMLKLQAAFGQAGGG